ncbi:Aste57867_18837 [Aphanomyces stellatus]|uniref:Aste57867_18837 protein n=1 Tax=Aphanomyces stellatus TaxID=120398 RepID=A0A485LBD6_9STRA|nr:hypothetical protein As57867_018773 [Aphanomyces stellatus]VFT95571.1 Aste57867_18837 [Aphanomyces stellatus]
MNAVEEEALLQFLISGPETTEVKPIDIQIDLDGLLDAPLDDDDDAPDDATENSATDETSSVDGGGLASGKQSPNGSSNGGARPDMKRKMQLAKASKKHRARQKDELNLLRDVVTKMEGQLDMLKKVKAIEGEHGSQWEQLARSQYLERQKANQENQKLKRALEDQIKFAQALETLVRKKPKLTSATDFENEEWKLSKLGLTLEGRRYSMRCIMERQYEALNGVLVRNGLYDATSELKQVKMSYQDHTGSMSFDMVRAIKMPFPFRLYAEAAWAFLAATESGGECADALDVVDPNTRYISRKVCKSGEGGCPFFGKSRATIICSPLCQRYVEESRVVILWKSILEDELHPRDPSVLVSNQNGWMVIEADGDGSCHVKSYVERLAPMRAGKIVALDEMMKSMHIPTCYDEEVGKRASMKRDPSAQVVLDEMPTEIGATSEYFMRSFIGMAQCNEEQTVALAKKFAAATPL